MHNVPPWISVCSVILERKHICISSFTQSSAGHRNAGHGSKGAHLVHLVHFVISAGIALSVIGAVQITSNNASTRNHSATFRKAGSLVILCAYTMLAFFLATFWFTLDRFSRFHHKVSTTLLFFLWRFSWDYGML